MKMPAKAAAASQAKKALDALTGRRAGLRVESEAWPADLRGVDGSVGLGLGACAPDVRRWRLLRLRPAGLEPPA